MTTTTPPKVKTIEEIVNNLCAIWSFGEATIGYPKKEVYGDQAGDDYWEIGKEQFIADLRTAIIEVLESMSYEVDNRYLTIKWLWNKEKTDTDKLIMVHKQMEHIKQLLENISKLKETK